ncbi:hypothetical protein PMI21_05355 [Pseudomonas sp. GM18]|nr:hypothetical protein PMI21_05355 [Pseudomonas sp. GM18]
MMINDAAYVGSIGKNHSGILIYFSFLRRSNHQPLTLPPLASLMINPGLDRLAPALDRGVLQKVVLSHRINLRPMRGVFTVGLQIR